jgi:hypothetical protein
MAINKSKSVLILGIILTIFFFTNMGQGNNRLIILESGLKMNSPSEIIVNKVYNFTLERPFIYFHKNLFFEDSYNYYLTLTIVTPHSCDMNITLWDPEGDEYCLSYEENMIQNDYREIPYGVAINGNYSILFSAILSENLNILISIERGGTCLFDKIQSDELADIIFFDVLKFYNRTYISHIVTLKTDMYYRFYFGRVSPISKKLNSFTALTHTITDETQEILFSIYTNNSVASTKNITSYQFGTAMEGEYRLNLTIFCDVKVINVAYAIVEKQKISDETDPNDDDPPSPPDDHNNGTGIIVFIPKEWTISMIVFVGSAVGIPVIIIIYRKKKNPTGI